MITLDQLKQHARDFVNEESKIADTVHHHILDRFINWVSGKTPAVTGPTDTLNLPSMQAADGSSGAQA